MCVCVSVCMCLGAHYELIMGAPEQVCVHGLAGALADDFAFY